MHGSSLPKFWSYFEAVAPAVLSFLEARPGERAEAAEAPPVAPHARRRSKSPARVSLTMSDD